MCSYKNFAAVLVLSLLASHALAHPQAAKPADGGKQKTESKTTIIPFTLTKWNNVSIKATVNKTEQVDLMFHTANQSIVLTVEAVQKMKAIKFGQTGTGNSWGGKSSMRFSKGNSLQIGDRTWNDITIYEDKLSGRSTDGKFGPDLFTGKVIEMDFAKSELRIHDQMPSLDAGYQELDFVSRNGAMFVNGQFSLGEETFSNELMIHSGYSGSILLDDAFADKHDLAEKLKTISVSELRDSYGNVLKTKKVVMPKFSMGAIEFVDVPVGIFAGSIKRQKMSLMGGDLIKRFDLVIDAENSKLYLRPNKLKDEKYFE